MTTCNGDCVFAQILRIRDLWARARSQGGAMPFLVHEGNGYVDVRNLPTEQELLKAHYEARARARNSMAPKQLLRADGAPAPNEYPGKLQEK